MYGISPIAVTQVQIEDNTFETVRGSTLGSLSDLNLIWFETNQKYDALTSDFLVF